MYTRRGYMREYGKRDAIHHHLLETTSDCKCARIETKASEHQSLWVAAVYKSLFRIRVICIREDRNGGLLNVGLVIEHVSRNSKEQLLHLHRTKQALQRLLHEFP